MRTALPGGVYNFGPRSVGRLPDDRNPRMRLCPICGAKPGHSCLNLLSLRPRDGAYPKTRKTVHRERRRRWAEPE